MFSIKVSRSDLVKFYQQGRIQDFKLGGGGGAHLKKLPRAEGGANIFGVFRVKNHYFTPKNHIFSDFRAGCAPPPPPGSASDQYREKGVLTNTMSIGPSVQDQTNFA